MIQPIEGASGHHQRLYEMGFEARSAGRPKMPPSGMSFQGLHWWLAGWNDRDIEINGPATPAKVVRRGKP